ncbi:MAG: hypothetical protein JWM82_4205 [Myxococcales bacterium]|nr:hypothetical protein [Myxococcales bacterium]
MAARLCLVALLCFVGCDGCRHGDTARCGKCATSSVCRPGLACVNGVCETAPPSCHVDIGL